MTISRRGLLKAGVMGGAGIALPLGMFALGATRKSSPQVDLFAVPLPIPPIAQPVRVDDNGDYYEITQREAAAQILPGLTTTIWGYDGIFPGPTIEARSGRQVIVRQANDLQVPVVTHLHGGVTPPESDGYPTDLILPRGGNGSFAHADHASGNVSDGVKEYRYPNQQRAATLWYHDHRMDFTGPQVYRGLAGLYIVRDEIEETLPLPVGEKEVPLIITDRIFNEDGSFFYPSRDPSLTEEPGLDGDYANGMFGDTILVNGAPWPELEVSNTRYRFRILNASNARVYELGLDPRPDGDSFVQIGSDGGLLTEPRGCRTIPIAPAERFDVIVDFSRFAVGTEVTLRNLAVQDPFAKGRTSKIMRFRVVREERDESTIPAQLAPEEELPDPEQAEETRRFNFSFSGGMWTINGEPFHPDRLWAQPRLDATEIWELTSNRGHPVHLHLVHFRVLSRNGRRPHASDTGWKDTIFLGENVRVIARFSGYRGKYVFHCHNLEHEDMMMMANFEVV